MEPVDRQPNYPYNSHSGGDTLVKSSVNHTLAFSNIRVSKQDLINVSRQVTSLILDKCISDEWQQILKRVANLT
jgi:hypothetical protein